MGTSLSSSCKPDFSVLNNYRHLFLCARDRYSPHIFGYELPVKLFLKSKIKLMRHWHSVK